MSFLDPLQQAELTAPAWEFVSGCFSLLTAPRGGSTAAPDKFWALVAADSGVWKIIPSLEFGCQRSLALGFCQFLAALGISGKSWQIYGGSLALLLSAGDGQDFQSLDQKSVLESWKNMKNEVWRLPECIKNR